MPRVPGVRTARKLLVGFGVGLAFVTTCSLFALVYLSRLNGMVRHLAFDPVPGSAAIASVAKDFNQYVVLEVSGLGGPESESALLTRKAADIERDLKAYEVTITQGDDHQRFADLVALWSNYSGLHAETATRREPAPPGGVALVRNQREKTSEEINALLATMIDWNRLEGVRSIEAADSATRAASATVLSMLVAALILSAVALYTDAAARTLNEALDKSREQLQRLADGLLMAREEERTTIAREVHDVLGQTLTALKMDTAWIGLRVPQAVPALSAKLAAMSSLIDDAVMTVRRIATDLRPGVLDDLGLAAAVEWQVQQFQQRSGIPCVLHARAGHDALDPLVSTAMFRILQESLTNVARHSRASHVTVTLEHRDAALVLEVRDDGVGITPGDASTARSIGLTGMRERAQLVGGDFSISGAAGNGTTVLVRIPQREAISV